MRGWVSTPRNLAWSPDGKNLAFEAWYLKGEKERELKGIVVMKVPEQQILFHTQDAAKFQANLFPPRGKARPAPPGGRRMARACCSR